MGSTMTAGIDGLRFHHFGLAVQGPEPAFLYLRTLGYREGRQVFDPLQRVNLAMRHHATMPDVEVIWPGDEPSPIDRLIKRMGSLIYHTCYECSQPDLAIAALEAVGLEVVPVSPPTPAVLFGGREVSFYSISGIGIVELLRTDPP